MAWRTLPQCFPIRKWRLNGTDLAKRSFAFGRNARLVMLEPFQIAGLLRRNAARRSEHCDDQHQLPIFNSTQPNPVDRGEWDIDLSISPCSSALR